MKDSFDLPVTTNSAATLAALDVYAADWLGYGTRLRTIFAAADDDPGCAFVNAHAAAVHMALEAAPGYRAARPYLKRARAAARDGTVRERLFVKAVLDWARGDTGETLARLDELVCLHPTDLVAAKWGQYHAFNLGDAKALLRTAQWTIPAHTRTPEAWGMLAFGHEQCGEIDAAERAATHALTLKRAEPWAHHAMAHVMETRGRVDEGVAFLTAQTPTWADRSVFIREHNYWHLALFHLDREEHGRALDIFDKHLWGEWPEFAQEQIGAISMLWRMELRGVDAGARWAPVVEQVVARWHEHILPFHDLHFVFALARGGRRGETRAFLSSLERRGAQDETGAWDGVALPVARGLVAFAEGRFDMAAELIGGRLDQLWRIGGSHAQRDVFVQTWIEAALRSGRTSAAADLLQRRARERPGIASTRQWLARARAA